MQVKIPQLLANEIEAVASGYGFFMSPSEDGSYVIEVPDISSFRQALSQVGELAQDNLTYESDYLEPEEKAQRKAIVKLVKQYLKKYAATSVHQVLAWPNNSLSGGSSDIADEDEAMDGQNMDKEETVPLQPNEKLQPDKNNPDFQRAPAGTGSGKSSHVELKYGN